MAPKVKAGTSQQPNQQPDFIPVDSSPDFIPYQEPTPAAPQPASATSRFLEGAKAGMGGDNALSNPVQVDPNRNYLRHPNIANNPLIPGSGVYRDIKSGNYAGAAGRVVAPVAAVGAALFGGRGKISEPAPPVETSVKPLATAPVRYAARMAESAVNQKLVPVKPLLRINTPADEAAAIHIKVPGRDLGLPKPSMSEGLPEVEAARPEATANLKARIATERNLRAQEPFPRVSEGLPEVEAAQPQATAHLHKALEPNPSGPRIATSPSRVSTLLNEATGGKQLNPKVPLRNQLDNVAPVAPKESSVIKSHSYDQDAKELTFTTHSGQTYKYGDVSPDQAAEFANGSKGQALNRLKKSGSVLVEKNGKPVTPIGPRMADPNDLTPALEESVKAVKARKSSDRK